MSDDHQGRFGQIWESTLFGVVLALFIIFSFAASGMIAVESKQLEVASFVVNAILTGTLILVYTRIGRFQKEQTEETRKQAELQEELADVQRNQTEIMEYQKDVLTTEHEPNVVFSNREVDGDQLIYECRNSGPGLALDIGLVTETEIDPSGFQTTPKPPYDSRRIVYLPERTTETKTASLGVLRPGQKDTYAFRVMLAVPTGDGEIVELPYLDAVEQLAEQGIGEVTVSLRIDCADVGGNPAGAFMNKIRIPVPEQSKLSEVL